MIAIATLSLMVSLCSVPNFSSHIAALSAVQAPESQAVYDNGYQNDWQYWGWGTVAYAAPSGDTSGAKPIKVQLDGWQGIVFHHTPFDTGDYSAISFRIHGGAKGGQSLWVQVLIHSKATNKDNAAPEFFVVPAPKPGMWMKVVVPLKDLKIKEHASVTGFWLQSRSASAQGQFYLNNIRLVR